MPWKKLLACVTGQIDEGLRQKLEFVLEENRVYRVLLERHSPHWRLQDAERKVLAEKGKPLGKLSRTSSPWCNPKRCSNGIANWSPVNGTFPAAGTPNRVGRPSQLRLNNWWCNSPAKTQAGVMTASSAPWLTWGITFPIRRWAIFCNDRGWARHPNANATPPGPRSSAGTRPCSGPPTSSPLKSGPPPA